MQTWSYIQWLTSYVSVTGGAALRTTAHNKPPTIYADIIINITFRCLLHFISCPYPFPSLLCFPWHANMAFPGIIISKSDRNERTQIPVALHLAYPSNAMLCCLYQPLVPQSLRLVFNEAGRVSTPAKYILFLAPAVNHYLECHKGDSSSVSQRKESGENVQQETNSTESLPEIKGVCWLWFHPHSRGWGWGRDFKHF